MAIDFKRAEYETALPEWELIDACVQERNLKTLLPKLNARDNTPENEQRNKDYQDRASWFGASAFTLQGLVGTAFEDAPAIELPPGLEYLRSNCDGEGTDLQQQMQSALSGVLSHGRVGVFTTFPPTEGAASQADVQALRAVATIHFIDAKRVINWWTEKRGAQVVLGGVIWTGVEDVWEDYAIKQKPIIRELSLKEGVPTDTTWRKVKDGGREEWQADVPRSILGANGDPLSSLPFTFCGAMDNTTALSRPPMLGLARLNRAHYRNSADYEEGAFYAGQAVPYIEPVDGVPNADDLSEAKKSGWYVGSRQVIVGRMGFAQADPNMASRQAMLDKEDQMRALGARLLEPGTVAKTATEASGEMRAQHSVLSLASQNVEDAYNRALGFAGEFIGDAGAASVKMTREYMRRDVADQRIANFIQLWDRGLVGAPEAHRVLSSAAIVDPDKSPEDYAEELAQRGALQEPMTGGNV